MARRHILTSLCCATSLWTTAWLGAAVAAIAPPPAASVTATGAMVEDRPLRAIAQTPSGYTLLHVNPTAGDDLNGDGGQMRPLKTITHALQIAAPNTIIVLSPGLYNAASGERFPLQLRSGITLQGTPNPNTANVIIQGSGTHLTPSQGLRHITLLGADQAGLANVTVSNPHPQGHGVWIEAGSPVIVQNAFVGNGATGIYIAGNGSPVIQGNYFFENGEAGLVVNGPSSAQIQNNVFENTGVGIAVAPAATPLIVGNQIFHNREGLVLHAEALPQLRNNQIRDNRRNSVLDYSPWPNATPTDLAAAPAVEITATPTAVTPSRAAASTVNPPATAAPRAQPTTTVAAPATPAVPAAPALSESNPAIAVLPEIAIAPDLTVSRPEFEPLTGNAPVSASPTAAPSPAAAAAATPAVTSSTTNNSNAEALRARLRQRLNAGADIMRRQS
ncbi:MAG: DUF1565 domain-containing protein [Leptolyngbya sp. RL_3_1]|nr:DUF1565 domain-containing protein [Leptolyngbya sp. RL_3_1]